MPNFYATNDVYVTPEYEIKRDTHDEFETIHLYEANSLIDLAIVCLFQAAMEEPERVDELLHNSDISKEFRKVQDKVYNS